MNTDQRFFTLLCFVKSELIFYWGRTIVFFRPTFLSSSKIVLCEMLFGVGGTERIRGKIPEVKQRYRQM